MKIIIAYASAGNGHYRAAEAIQQYLNHNYPEISVRIVNILEYTNSILANSYSRGYAFLVTHTPFLWTVTYYLTGFNPFLRTFRFFCYFNCRCFEKMIINEKPDIVLATHFFPADVVSRIKQKGKINSRLITVITDFGVHPLWRVTHCDDYIVAADYTMDCLVKQGVVREKIRVMGIPVSPEFTSLSRLNREKKNSDKEENKTTPVKDKELTALLVTGSFGFSVMEKIVDMLFSEIKLIVVCGKNEKLYKALKQKNYTGVRVVGFTKEIHQFMAESDLIITKPGGLTISEALVMELPQIFINCIPGQETENAKVLQLYGCGKRAKDIKALKNIMVDLKNNPEIVREMKSNIQKIKKINALDNICRFLR